MPVQDPAGAGSGACARPGAPDLRGGRVVIVGVAVTPDHIHMLVAAPADVAPAKLVQMSKGGSTCGRGDTSARRWAVRPRALPDRRCPRICSVLHNLFLLRAEDPPTSKCQTNLVPKSDSAETGTEPETRDWLLCPPGQSTRYYQTPDKLRHCLRARFWR